MWTRQTILELLGLIGLDALAALILVWMMKVALDRSVNSIDFDALRRADEREQQTRDQLKQRFPANPAKDSPDDKRY